MNLNMNMSDLCPTRQLVLNLVTLALQAVEFFPGYVLIFILNLPVDLTSLYDCDVAILLESYLQLAIELIDGLFHDASQVVTAPLARFANSCCLSRSSLLSQ